MSIDPSTLAEARALVADAAMAGFVPANVAAPSTGGELIAIALIDPPARSTGTPNFDKPDPDMPGVRRSASILAAIRNGSPLPPFSCSSALGSDGTNCERASTASMFMRRSVTPMCLPR
ncbi:hypothetical protein [Xanthomonas oryzae]|uniref:hypothetical protein n=1 Tax=Xanthomonas oryzae TaxID=347 RepID=UPI001CCBBDA9|nr:hypothetical protein [Xanthomonas oryzae]MEC5080745.1 hypothetical protein [Xanthomonas oryzae pv. oryzicola]MEC5115664.1 hypothetical protein [Xanthomonas oryzae pv. oryzicola]